MGLEIYNKLSDIINFISPDKRDSDNNIAEKEIYFISFDCNFDLIVVCKDRYNFCPKKYNCSKILIEYDKLFFNPMKLSFYEDNIIDSVFEFKLSHPLYISKDKKVAYNCDYYISDDINFIKKYMVDCLNFEVNKKLDEIAAIYNKYGEIDKIRL